jgi:hypothetical protein
MEGTRSSETSVDIQQTTGRYTPEDNCLLTSIEDIFQFWWKPDNYRHFTCVKCVSAQVSISIWAENVSNESWSRETRSKSKNKTVSTMPRGHTGEWRYSSTILHLYTRQRCVVSFTTGESAHSTHWAGGWVGPRGGLALRRRENLTPTGNRIPKSSSQLYRVSYRNIKHI